MGHFGADLPVKDVVEKKLCFCSAFLVSAIFTYTCVGSLSCYNEKRETTKYSQIFDNCQLLRLYSAMLCPY